MGSQAQCQFQVQDPVLRGPFAKEDLVWTTTVKARVFQPGSCRPMPVLSRYAFILWSRVADFIAGEEARKGFPTSFFKMSTKRSIGPKAYRTGEFTYSEFTQYWCAYGKDDFRSPRIAAEGQLSQGKRRSKICSGQSIKHGCLCHFDVKRLLAWPHVAAIFYHHTEHVDAAGLICHGVSYLGNPRARLAPHLSSDIRIWVKKKLLGGMSKQEVLAEHRQNVKRRALQPGYVEVRDDLLQMSDLDNIEKANVACPLSPQRDEVATPAPEVDAAAYSPDASDVLRPSEGDQPVETREMEVESLETMEYFMNLLAKIQQLVQSDPKLLEYACPISRDMLSRLKDIQGKQVEGVSWDLTILSKLDRSSGDTTRRKRPFLGNLR